MIKITENEGIGAGGTASTTSSLKKSTEKQSAVIYDMLSEGPVEGLVDGAASIFLDGTAVMEGANNKSFGAVRSTNVTYTASSRVLVDNNGSLFSGKDLTEGTYYIKVRKAGKTGTVSASAGSTVITASSAIFSPSDRSTLVGGKAIHIPGAGVNGSDYVGVISRYISTTRVSVRNPIQTTVSSVTAHVDLVAVIASIQSSAQATLSGDQGINASNVLAYVKTPTQIVTSTPKYNFENTAVAFRPGTRDQSYLKPPVGLGSSAIVYNASGELAQTDLSSLSGIGSSPNNAAGWSNTSEPTASRTANRFTASQMGVSNPGEVDQISISINFPNGIYAHKPKSGSEGATNAEFIIDFDYSTDGTTFTTTRVFGASDSSLSARGNKLTYPNTNNYGSGTVRRFTRTPFTQSFSFDVEKYQPFVDYRVNIQKITPAQAEHGNFNHTAASSLQAIQNIIEDKLSYPYTAYGAVIVDAQNFSSLPVRGYDLRGLKIKVPTNYFPRNELSEGSIASYTRHVTNGSVQSSAQDWDGNFRGDLNTFTTGTNIDLVWTDNPVWVLLDLLTNDRYGLGKFIDPNDDFALIDKFQLYQLAQYCDELIPDGKGGVEPRFTCNMYITELAEAQRHLSDLISIFRGMLIYFNGKITPQVNSKKSPIYTFSKGNVVEGVFSYQSSSSRFRSNQIRVTWNNPEAFYRQDVEVVEDTENILETNRINPTEVVALGCTSQGQAIRFGKWILLTEKMSTEVVSFSTGLNAAHLKPGDLVEIQDSDIYTTQSSGRVDSEASSSTTVVRLDRAVDLSASGTNFDLNLVYPTGGAYLNEDSAIVGSTTFERGDLLTSITSQTAAANAEDDAGNKIQVLWSEYSRIESKPIQSYSTNVITVSSAFSSAPNAEVMWSITATTQATGEIVSSAPKPFQIVSIQEDSNEKTYSISATGYSDNLFDLVERGYVIEEIPDIRKPPLRTDIIPVPQSLGLSAIPSGKESTSEDVDIEGTGIDLLIGWNPPQSTVSGSNKKYEFTAGYELMILGLEDEEGKGIRKTIQLGPDSTGHRIKDVTPGVVYTVFLRIQTTNGFYSAYIKDEIEVVASKITVVGGPKISGLSKGGSINQTVTMSGAVVSIGSSTYQFDSPDGSTHNNTSTNTSTYQQSFAGMGASAVAYLLFDTSASATGDRFKAVQFVENNTAVSANGDSLGIKYWKEVGAANDGLTAASGTASMAVSSNLITGSSTSFTTDFEVGDKVFVGSGTSLFMATINSISSDTSMRVNTNTTRAYSGVAVKKQTFIPSADVILAKIETNGSTSYSISELYAITKGIIGADGQNGLNNAIITLYQVSNSSSSPTLPSGNATYTFSNATLGSFASSANGWSQTLSSVSSSNKYLWATQASASSTGATVVIGDSAWTAGKIMSTFGDDGSPGATGPRTTTFRLNHTAASSGQPTSPTSSNTNSYNFSNGTLSTIVSGWSHSTPTYASGNSNKYWYVDVTVVEATFNGTQTITFGTVRQAIGFSGLVTFSNANTISDGTNTKTPIQAGDVNANVTSIDGDVIQTGTIKANRLALSGTGAITIGSFTNDSGFTDDTVANQKTTAAAAATAANNAAKTAGSVGGLTLTSTKMHLGTGTFNNSNTAFYVDNSSNFSLGNKLSWNGSTLSITGNISIANASSVRSDLNVADGATDDTVANQKTTAAAAAAAANSAAKTAGSIGGLNLAANKVSIGTGTFNNSNTGFYVDSSGNFSLKDKLSFNASTSTLTINGTGNFSGTVTIGGTALDATNTFNSNTTANDVGLGNVNNTTDASVLSSAATAANSAAKTAGTVAAWTISATKISNSKIEIDNTNERILIKDS